jgi:hypothetical protein
MTPDEAQELLELARGEPATDDRFELDWLRDRLTCAAS